jgi:chorismate synthase
MNSFGKHIKLTTFGESHGVAIGGVIEGFPAGINVEKDFIQSELNRRKPSSDKASTTRKESDRIEILSGIFEGKTLGTPIAFIIRNENQQPGDYEYLREIYRPGHADFTYDKKYGHYDHRSGGRASARETATRVVAGAFAKTILEQKNIEISAHVKQIGTAHTPDEIEHLLEQAKNEGDSLGGIVECVIKGVPVGIGEPIFGKLQAQLAEAMMSIPAAKGFEYGEGFRSATMKGSEHNDVYLFDNGEVKPATNHSGGILGGISTGQDIVFRVVFKPISSISKLQKTVDKQGNPVELINHGRHDVCCVPRAVPIVEAMAALVIADNLVLDSL